MNLSLYSYFHWLFLLASEIGLWVHQYPAAKEILPLTLKTENLPNTEKQLALERELLNVFNPVHLVDVFAGYSENFAYEKSLFLV